MFLFIAEVLPKGRAELRAPLEQALAPAITDFIRGIAESFTPDSAERATNEILRLRLLDGPDLSLACGSALVATYLLIVHASATESAEASGLFRDLQALYLRVCPAPLLRSPPELGHEQHSFRSDLDSGHDLHVPWTDTIEAWGQVPRQ